MPGPVSLLLIRRRRPTGEPPEVVAALEAGQQVVEAPLTGRIGEVLGRLETGLAATGLVVTQWLPDLDAGPATLDTVHLGARYELVVLASHLVNTPEPVLRGSLLRAASRHAAPEARVLVEHHPTDWLETAAASWSERDGRRLGMVEVRVEPPFVSAVSVYEVGSEVVRQPFTARVLSDAELDAQLDAAGLAVRGRLSPTWLEAAPAGGHSR